jgi:DNA-nicking Smr family endonuclease
MQRQVNLGIIELDIHGMTKFQAKIYIDSQLKVAKQNIYRFRIIHGFHNGTELKDMVRKTYRNHPKVIRIECGLNQGETDLVLRDLF